MWASPYGHSQPHGWLSSKPVTQGYKTKTEVLLATQTNQVQGKRAWHEGVDTKRGGWLGAILEAGSNGGAAAFGGLNPWHLASLAAL